MTPSTLLNFTQKSDFRYLMFFVTATSFGFVSKSFSRNKTQVYSILVVRGKRSLLVPLFQTIAHNNKEDGIQQQTTPATNGDCAETTQRRNVVRLPRDHISGGLVPVHHCRQSGTVSSGNLFSMRRRRMGSYYSIAL